MGSWSLNTTVTMLASDLLAQLSDLKKSNMVITAWLSDKLVVTDQAPDVSYQNNNRQLLLCPNEEKAARTLTGSASLMCKPGAPLNAEELRIFDETPGSLTVVATELSRSLKRIPFSQVFTSDLPRTSPEVQPYYAMTPDLPRFTDRVFAVVLSLRPSNVPEPSSLSQYFRYPAQAANNSPLKSLLDRLNIGSSVVANDETTWHSSFLFCRWKAQSRFPGVLAFLRDGIVCLGCRHLPAGFDCTEAITLRNFEGLDLPDQLPGRCHTLAPWPADNQGDDNDALLARARDLCSLREVDRVRIRKDQPFSFCVQTTDGCELLVACWSSKFGSLR
jgi:hypothetical protein